MDDTKLFLSFWKFIATAVAVVILSMSGCSISEHHTIQEMVASGADPIAAGCAVSGGSPGVCEVFVATQGR